MFTALSQLELGTILCYNKFDNIILLLCYRVTVLMTYIRAKGLVYIEV